MLDLAEVVAHHSFWLALAAFVIAVINRSD